MSRWSERVWILMFSAPQNRAWAKGRSAVTVSTSTEEGRLATSLLKRWVWVEQTAVSSEGATERMRVLPLKLSRETSPRLLVKTLKLGALSPTLMSGPRRVKGPPLKVTTPLRSCMCLSLKSLFLNMPLMDQVLGHQHAAFGRPHLGVV